MEHPITTLTEKMERAHRDVARLDAWLCDPANETSDDWEYEYREMRRARATAERCRVAILRLDRALYGDPKGITARLIEAARGQRTYYRPSPALMAFKRR